MSGATVTRKLIIRDVVVSPIVIILVAFLSSRLGFVHAIHAKSIKVAPGMGLCEFYGTLIVVPTAGTGSLLRFKPEAIKSLEDLNHGSVLGDTFQRPDFDGVKGFLVTV